MWTMLPHYKSSGSEMDEANTAILNLLGFHWRKRATGLSTVAHIHSMDFPGQASLASAKNSSSRPANSPSLKRPWTLTATWKHQSPVESAILP